MPRISDYFHLNLTQHQLDFVNIDTDHDTAVYVDPYAIEIRSDVWATRASENIRTFFNEVLEAIRNGDDLRAQNLMSHLNEPRETFLGVSKGDPHGRGVGRIQSGQLISAIRNSRAFQTGLLSDLSEMALYVEGVDRDKISDLTTNIIRDVLVDYTNAQCALYGIQVEPYNGPPLWDKRRLNWTAQHVNLPVVDGKAVLLVPKYIVRRVLSLNSQEFYNKQLTDFFVAENIRAHSGLVQMVKGQPKVFRGEAREQNPYSKALVAEVVAQNRGLLDLYKEIAAKTGALTNFGKDDDTPPIQVVCRALAAEFQNIPRGTKDADRYHTLVVGVLTALFYPHLVAPQKEWEIHDGRKRIDLVFSNASETGFFSHRRDDDRVHAATVITECKNYSNDIANQELDQLLARFDRNRGYFGILTCRALDNPKLVQQRCGDAAVRRQGFVIVLTDADLIEMLNAKAELDEERIELILNRKYRDLLR